MDLIPLSKDSMCSFSSEIIHFSSMVNYFTWEILKNYFPHVENLDENENILL